MEPLNPYPFPDGVDVPRLMPFQEYPWNNDHHLAAEVLRLKEAHGLKYAYETGTCLGSTALWLAEHFERVHTYEIYEPTWTIALARIPKSFPRSITAHLKHSATGLRAHSTHDAFYFLDAHWGDHCPLLEELDALVGRSNIAIVIHDFHVPGTTFGFDRMPNGTPFNLDLIRLHLDAIYGVDGWQHNYPSAVAGAERGWISIEPT